MQIIVHRGTHQIGGVATEIRTSSTRLLVDMGEELGLTENFTPKPLSIPGVTDANGRCDGVFFTHHHADHIGQLKNVRPGIALYMGALTKQMLLLTLPPGENVLKKRIAAAHTFTPGKRFYIGDIAITPVLTDHSACDSYMFLLESGGKRILHTGDFRLHGFRGKGVCKWLKRLSGRLDALIIEGTALDRPAAWPVAERILQQQLRAYLKRYTYVFVLAAASNVERICAFSKAVPRGKYFICDAYQYRLLRLIQQQWGAFSPLYRDIKAVVYTPRLEERFSQRGFVMMVRDNRKFREIIRRFDADKSLLLYSLWDGYRTRPGSSLASFLALTPRWAPLHTSGHAAPGDLQRVIAALSPQRVIPIHTQAPARLKALCPGASVVLPQDGEALDL